MKNSTKTNKTAAKATKTVKPAATKKTTTTKTMKTPAAKPVTAAEDEIVTPVQLNAMRLAVASSKAEPELGNAQGITINDSTDVIKPEVKAAKAQKVTATPLASTKKVKTSTGIETKGKSKVSVDDVLNMRRLKVKHPELSAQKIKDQLNLKLSAIMVGRALRGISHGHIDMCGLPVRPFEHGKAVQVKLDRKEVRKTERAAKKTAATV